MSFVSKKAGFTLIELLVVISIIGIVMSIGIANLITAQKQARDASRKQIIHNIQTAFEQYYAGVGVYPATTSDAFEDGNPPADPRENETPIEYNITTSAYCVCATLEGGGGNASGATGTSCSWLDGGDYYCAQNKQ
ncbi:type II secretion system protein [Candidatus Woesebacteria bacterium]|nr:type II secretion system protein [Candidatus Woesebacteria bacterium]